MRLLWVAALVCACSSKSDKDMPRLVTEKEIAEYEAAIMKRIDERKARTCERPPVRGTPAPGPAGPDVRTVVEGTGELADCRTKLEASRKNADLKAKVNDRDPAFVALAKECGPTFDAAIAKAIAHTSACSPYQIGVYGSPIELMPLMATMHLVGLAALERADAGDPAGALGSLVDSMQLSDDFTRGETTLIHFMVATAASQILAERAFEILEKHRVAPDALAPIVAALGTLAKYQPSMHEVLLGENDATTILYALAPLKPAGWVPPGGWPLGEDPRPKGETKIETKLLTKNPRDEYAIMFIAAAATREDFVKACPASATLEQCFTGFSNVSAPKAEPDSTAVMAKLYRDLSKSISPDEARLITRAAIVEVLGRVATPFYGDYAKKRARLVAQLAALRIHAELWRLAGGSRCPDAKEVEGLLDVPNIGRMVVTQEAPPGTRGGATIDLAPPAWLGEPKDPKDKLRRWVCPLK